MKGRLTTNAYPPV